MRRRSASLLVFLLCLALGLAGGLSYAWLVAPRPFASEAANSALGAAPDRLNPIDRDLYLRLVAAAYAADGNRDQAAARLAAAGPDATAHLAALLAADLAAGRPVADLAQLATALGLDAPAAALLAAPQPLAAATAVAPSDSLTTPSPAPSTAPVVVLGRQQLCADEAPRRLVVRVVDEAGRPQTGVAVTARWADEAGNDAASTAITGFAANGDAGTADFTMQPGAIYALELDGQIVAEELQLTACPEGLQGGWEIELQVE